MIALSSLFLFFYRTGEGGHIVDSVDCMKLEYVNCRVQQKDDVIMVVMCTT